MAEQRWTVESEVVMEKRGGHFRWYATIPKVKTLMVTVVPCTNGLHRVFVQAACNRIKLAEMYDSEAAAIAAVNKALGLEDKL